MTTPHPLREVKAPLFLRDLPIWLVWRYEADAASDKKPRKIPYYTNGSRRRGIQGSPADVAQLTNFEAAKEFAITNDFTGLGLCLLDGYHITGIDFDAVVTDDNGSILPEVEALIEGTYVEYSPSGKGIHAFVKGDLGNSKDLATSEQWGIELFNTKGFLTFTGHTTELCDITGCDNEISEPTTYLLHLIESRKLNRAQTTQDLQELNAPISLGLSIPEISAYLILLDPDHSYDQWIRIGMAIHHETGGSEDGFTLWDTWSANGPKYSSEELNRIKWESFAQISGKPITFRSVIKMVHHLSPATTTHDFEPILVADMSPIPANNALTSPINYIKSEHEFMREVKPTSWFIKGFLPRATLGVLYGESGSGKSFLALDICASIQRQVDWNGLRPPTTPCRVLYVIAEGVNGFVNRLTAYRREKSNGLIDYPLDFINDAPPNLMDKNSVAHLIKCIHEKGNYDLIVMDTFAQVTPGANENSGEDMGKALGYCRQIAQSSGGMVLLIHHAGKDSSRGVRGWSGLHAAADVVLEVSRFEDERSVKVVKSKDDLDGKEYGFSLDPIVLDFDEDGDPITSCTVSYHKAVKKRKKLSENQQAIVDVLNNFDKDSWVSIKHVMDLYMEEFAKHNSDPKGNQRTTLKRSILRMVGDLLEYNSETNEIRLVQD